MRVKEKVFLGIILIGYLVLSFNYALGPLFEAPDEALHYEYVRFIADEKAFPDPYTRTWSQFPQAPLYYMLLGPILMVMPDSHFAYKYGPNTYSPYPDQDGITPPNKAWENPYFVSSPDRNLLQQNRNFLLHSRSENFPYKDDPTARATFALRIASIVLGFITLWFCYQICTLLWPRHFYRRILALSSIAFLPLFQRVSASVNNDNLSILLGTLTLYLILLQINSAWTFKRSICLGVVLGLALSTKTYAGMLAVPVGIAIVLERRSWRYVPLILFLTILFGGWWYLHNLATHGWLVANDHPQILNTSANGKNEFVLDHALKTFPDIFTNMFARFDTLLVNIWLDRLFLIGLGLGFAGTAYIAIAYLRQIVVSGWSESYWLNVRQSLVIVAFILGWFATIFYASGVQSYGTQGRYALNAMAGLAA
ncbi:MAG: glycosyltransferase family 39 protein, partial [Chloroflexi bacterium]|nr:glycosyltransferase family 39 protein [Chloroflexota bacterium]